MKIKSTNCFLCFETGIYLLIFMILIPAILSIILAFCLNEFQFLYGLLLTFIGIIIIFLLRKTLFSKIILTEHNISRVYRNKIIKTIDWANLKIIKAIPKRHLIFLDKDIPDDEIWKEYNHSIYFYVNQQKILQIKPFVKIVNCPIKNLDILGEDYKQQLLK